MNSLAIETQELSVQKVIVTKQSLRVELSDGRTIITPLLWYPRLWHGTPTERQHFEIIGNGNMIHWPELDEDLSLAGILAGRRPRESAQSLKKWLATREPERRRLKSARSRRSGEKEILNYNIVAG